MASECILLKGGGGIDLDVITAGARDVLLNKVIVDKDGNPLTGTMPNNGAVTPSALNCGGSYTIPEGYHDGKGKVTANSLANQTSANANASHILLNQTAWVNGSKITGSMPNNGTQNKTITPSASAQSYTIPAGYHNGSGKVSVPAVSNLKAEYIKKGVVVGGVTGTWSGYVATATDLYLRGTNSASFTISSGSGTTFESGAIYKKSNGYLDLQTTKAYNLSPYTKLNIEWRVESKAKSYACFGMFYHIGSSSTATSTPVVNTTTLNSTVTLSIDISSVNVTPTKFFIRVASSDAPAGFSSTSLDLTCQIYRIWLS